MASSAMYGIGIVLLVLGVIGLVVGIGLAVIGPEAATGDEGFFGDGDSDSDERSEARVTGGIIAGVGAVLMLIGAVSFAASRT